jgi:hypothetical protein
MKLHGIRLFPLGLTLSAAFASGAVATSATAIAQAQSSQAPGSQVGLAASPQTKIAGATPIAPTADAAAPAPEPVYPKRPAEQAPKPPKVTCRGDQITISAENSTLDAILAAVRGCTGAKIDIPADASKVRSFEELGPAPVRKVLDDLLSGTPYNYVIQSSEANPLKVETVLLSVRTGDGGKPGSGSNSLSTDIPITAGRRAWQKMQKFDKPDPSTLNEDGTQVESTPDSPANETTAASMGQPTDGNQASAVANPAENAMEASTASTSVPPASAVAAPIADPNSTADPAKVMQDRIAAMQQMFAQRQQMMQKQSQPQSTIPNN